MDVNKSINIRLVQIVEKYPCLYNSSLKSYSKRQCTDRAWIEVAEQMNSTPDVVRDRWKCLRSVFVRRLKQLHMGELIKPYYLHEHMQFITPYLQNPWDAESRSKRQLEESEMRVASFTPNTSKTDINEAYYSDQENDNLFSMDDSTQQPPTSRSHKRKLRASRTSEEDDFHGFSEYHTSTLNASTKNRQIRDIVSNPTQDHNVTDDNYHKRLFMLSLLPDLEEMNNTQMREFKTKVISIINEIFEDDLKLNDVN
ncbi:PREDICTED: uncharacterized protein LOC108371479 isoform X1 [Rhagoletis zephyria]|uniref:uncharacterized protein LOC108371479 isoform X1 n=2 Tax=Rhagoletis zephyria TaxID=28612 RepID=UPI0008116617|nr:PREDICTED: uncharacterized protein LOC108371479 isoform X1 [Rhagoletis zephyria]